MDIEGLANNESNENMFHLEDLETDQFHSFSFPETPEDTCFRDDKIFYFSTSGKRASQEDYFDYVIDSRFVLIGMYDGHGGSTVAFHLKKNLLTFIMNVPNFLQDPKKAILQGIKELEKQILSNPENDFSGSAILVVFSDSRGTLVVNIGDVTCFGLKNILSNRKSVVIKSQLNFEHTLQNEHERIQVRKKGGLIFKRGGKYRIGGEINLSRTIGDGRYKPYLSSNPSIYFYPRENEDNNFSSLAIMTDGCEEAFQKIPEACSSLDEIQSHMANYGKYKDNATFLTVINQFVPSNI